MKCACLPQKTELMYLIPTIRKELAESLINKLSEKEIAAKLGLTKSAISQYLHKKRGSEIKFPRKIKSEIARAAKRILEGNSTDRIEIVRLLGVAKRTRYTCKVCKEVCK